MLNRFSGNSAFVQQHYAKLQQWASYLIQFSLLPGLQVSTGKLQGTILDLFPNFDVLNRRFCRSASQPNQPSNQRHRWHTGNVFHLHTGK